MLNKNNFLCYLWDVLGMDAVYWVPDILPGSDEQGEPKQTDN